MAALAGAGALAGAAAAAAVAVAEAPAPATANAAAAAAIVLLLLLLLLLPLKALVACCLLDQATRMYPVNNLSACDVFCHRVSPSTAWLLPLKAHVACLRLDQALHMICSHEVRTAIHFFAFSYDNGLAASRDVKHGGWKVHS